MNYARSMKLINRLTSVIMRIRVISYLSLAFSNRLAAVNARNDFSTPRASILLPLISTCYPDSERMVSIRPYPYHLS
jgi:hypothetical protein